MRPIENVCCFTGHRSKYFIFKDDESHPLCIAIKEFIRSTSEHLIAGKGVTHFIAGGAVGVDAWAMEEVIALRKKYPHITLECVLPYAGMEERFAGQSRERFTRIKQNLQTITTLNNGYHNHCLYERNRYMVDRSKYLIAVWTGIWSGTGYTVGYAKEQGREVHCMNPVGHASARLPRHNPAGY
jgi:uncharacterized phage-like protein YoqJ